MTMQRKHIRHAATAMLGVAMILVMFFGVAHADSLGIQPYYPLTFSNQAGSVSYAASTGSFTWTAPLDFTTFPDGSNVVISDPPTQPMLTIHFYVDKANCQPQPPSPADSCPAISMLGGLDFEATGTMPGYSSPLLTGQIIAFGTADDGGTSLDLFDFRFTITGGSLAPLYAGRDIAVSGSIENSTFAGRFDVDFGGQVIGTQFGPIAMDYGDAPDTSSGTGQGNYSTMESDNGPRHVIVSGVQLGAAVDAEADGQPNTMATGDDAVGVPDDEDFLVFLTPLVPGQVANMQVTVADPDGTGFGSLFIDFNGDGDFADADEVVLSDEPYSAGVHVIAVTVPASGTGAMGVRIRLTDNAGEGGASPIGPANSGEVEDYLLASLGDVNCDTSINATDALFILQYSVGTRVGTSCPVPGQNTMLLPVCDVSGGGACNATDALFILQCSVGIQNALCPAQAQALSPTVGAAKGEEVLADATISIGSAQVAPGNSATVPIEAILLPGVSLGAFDLKVTYDPALVTATGCTVNPVFFGLCNTNTGTPGQVAFSGISLNGQSGTVPLGQVTFQRLVPGTALLTLTVTNFATPQGVQISFDVINGAISDPLAVTLSSFDAVVEGDHVLVSWETVSEVNNVGFNLYRSLTADGELILLANLPSQAPGSTGGATYAYQDANVQAGQSYWYRLEAIDLSGATTLFDPVSVTFQAPTAVTLSELSTDNTTAIATGWLAAAALLVIGSAAGLAWRRRSAS